MPSSTANPDHPTAAGVKGTKHLWIVDDSEADQYLMQRSLKRHIDAECVHSYLSAEAAAVALDEGPPPHLVLLDLNMPGQGGPFFLRHRTERGLLHIPVVVLSSSSNPKDVGKVYALGANSFLMKPQDLAELDQMLAVLMPYWFRWSVFA